MRESAMRRLYEKYFTVQEDESSIYGFVIFYMETRTQELLLTFYQRKIHSTEYFVSP